MELSGHAARVRLLADVDEAADQVRTAQGHEQTDGGAVTETDNVDGLESQCFHESDRVVGELPVAERTLHVGSASVAAPLGPVDLVALRKARAETGERLDRTEPAVQQDERLTRALDLVIRVHAIGVDV